MSLEVRYDDDRQIDEIVGKECSVHLERLSAGSWCLIVYTGSTRGHFSIHKKKGSVLTTIVAIVPWSRAK